MITEEVENKFVAELDLPKNWSLVPFEESVFKNSIGKKCQINTSQILHTGEFPVVDQGQKFISGYSDDKGKVFAPNHPVIIFGDHTRIFKYIDFPFIIGADGTKVLMPNIDKFDPKFLFFCYSNLQIPNRGYNRHYTFLREQNLSCPPLPEQREIARILSAVQAVIAKQDELMQTTQALKKALMHKLFTEGVNGEVQKETEIGTLPESWEVVELAPYVKQMDYGTSVKCDYNNDEGNVPVLRIPNVVNGYVDATDLKFGPIKKAELSKLLKVGDLLFVRTNGVQENAGRCAVFNNELENCYYASYLIRVRLDEKQINSVYFNYYAQTEVGKRYLSGRASRIADGKFNINTGTLRTVVLPKPSIDEQGKIVNVLNSVNGKINFHKTRKQTLEALFRTLLHELMTGQRRVAVAGT